MEDDSHYQEYLNEHGGKGQPEVYRRSGYDQLFANDEFLKKRLFEMDLQFFESGMKNCRPFTDWKNKTSTGQETFKSMMGMGEKLYSFVIQSHSSYHPRRTIDTGGTRYWKVHWALYCLAKDKFVYIPNMSFLEVSFDIRPQVWEAGDDDEFDPCQLKAIINCPIANDLTKLDRSKYSKADQRIIQQLQGRVIINPYQYTPWKTMKAKIVEEMINFMSPEIIDFIARHMSGKAEIARVRSQEQLAWEALDRIVNLIKQ